MKSQLSYVSALKLMKTFQPNLKHLPACLPESNNLLDEGAL